MRPEKVSFPPEKTAELKKQAIIVPSVTLRTPVLDVFVFASKIRLEGKHHVADFAVRVYMREDEDANKKMLISERVARLELSETFENADSSKWPAKFNCKPSLFAEAGLFLNNLLSYNDDMEGFERASVYVKTNIQKSDLEKAIAYGTTEGSAYFQKVSHPYIDDRGKKQVSYFERFSDLKKSLMCAEKLTETDRRVMVELSDLLKTPKSQQLLDASAEENRERFEKPIVIKKEPVGYPYDLGTIPQERLETAYKASRKVVYNDKPSVSLIIAFGKQDFDKSTIDVGVRIYAGWPHQSSLLDQRIARLSTETPMIDYHPTREHWKKDRDPWDIMNIRRLVNNIVVINKIVTKCGKEKEIAFEILYPCINYVTNTVCIEFNDREEARCQLRKEYLEKRSKMYSFSLGIRLAAYEAYRTSLKELVEAVEAFNPQSPIGEKAALKEFLKPVVIGITSAIEKAPEPELEPKPKIESGYDVNPQNNNTTEIAQETSKQNAVKTHVEDHVQNNDAGTTDFFWESNYY